MIYLLVFPMTLLGSLGVFFFKKGTEQMGSFISLLRIPYIYVGGLLYLIGALLNILLLRYIDYTVLYPISSLGYVWSLFLSKKFLGETITRGKISGVLLIILGIVVLACANYR